MRLFRFRSPPAALSRTPITLPLTSSLVTALSPPKAASLPSGALHLCLYALSSMDNTCNNSLNSSIIPQAFSSISFALYRITNAWDSLAEQPPTPLLTKVSYGQWWQFYRTIVFQKPYTCPHYLQPYQGCFFPCPITVA